jgi:hypothetical protein
MPRYVLDTDTLWNEPSMDLLLIAGPRTSDRKGAVDSKVLSANWTADWRQ